MSTFWSQKMVLKSNILEQFFTKNTLFYAVFFVSNTHIW